MTTTYSIIESCDKSIFSRKMKRFNFHKNVMIEDEDSEVFSEDVGSIIVAIDYSDYDYLCDLM
jgi:hypothetical protein